MGAISINPTALYATEAPITVLLADWKEGNDSALSKLIPIAYRDLRRLAMSAMRNEGPGHTIQPTALVHEVFLRLQGLRKVTFEGRGHFFSIVSRLMRQILIQHARLVSAQKRGGGARMIDLDGQEIVSSDPRQASDLLAIEEALTELARIDPKKAEIVEMRYFGGFTIPEISEAVGQSTATVDRHMRSALAWLRRQMQPAREV
jgi:RNA polymerase sigma-70 factor (ECF subfamily)